jgi:hypothetical protein
LATAFAGHLGSARKSISSGATGHLIGSSAMFTTMRPAWKPSSARRNARVPSSV